MPAVWHGWGFAYRGGRKDAPGLSVPDLQIPLGDGQKAVLPRAVQGEGHRAVVRPGAVFVAARGPVKAVQLAVHVVQVPAHCHQPLPLGVERLAERLVVGLHRCGQRWLQVVGLDQGVGADVPDLADAGEVGGYQL